MSKYLGCDEARDKIRQWLAFGFKKHAFNASGGIDGIKWRQVWPGHNFLRGLSMKLSETLVTLPEQVCMFSQEAVLISSHTARFDGFPLQL